MATLLVSYDLKTPGADYNGFYDVLKECPAWWHHLESTWFVVTNDTPDELYDKLEQHLRPADNLIILTVHAAPRQGWLQKRAWKWLDKHLG
jgi:hypothetical protein